MQAAPHGATRRNTPPRCSGPVAIAVLLLGLVATPVRAADVPAPGNTVEFGFEERVRTENFDNAVDFDRTTLAGGDARHQIRFRTRLWERLRFGERAEFMLQVNNESRRVTTPDTRFAWDETVIENLYADVRCGAQSIRIGRQDIWRGDGLVLGDGGPLDGSRTAYMNAIVLTRAFGGSKLELMGITNPRRDLYLPPIRDQRKPMVEWNERALVFYLTGGGGRMAGLEAYYMFKAATDDVRSASHPAFQTNRDVHTLGARRAWDVSGGYSGSVEIAGQTGTQRPDANLLAWAGTVTSRKTFTAAGRPSLSLGIVALSGDDTDTRRIEGWDPLFGRWPRWSELYIYTLAGERGPAYWTNYRSAQIEMTTSPLGWLQVRASYTALGAFHHRAVSGLNSGGPPDPSALFSSGTMRGTLAILRADFKVHDGLRGHVLGERLDPDTFYRGTDPAWFFRAELIFSLSRRLGI